MIGPSSKATGEVTESQCRGSKRKVIDDLDLDSSKRKIFDELDIDSFCEDVRQTSRKLQELETPVELVATSNDIIANTTGYYSPMSIHDAVDKSQVAHFEVLLLDGTSCAWTTVSELEQQQNLDVLVTSSSSSTLSSSLSTSSGCAERHSAESYAVEEANYQSAVPVNYWEPVAVPAISLANSNVSQNKATKSNGQQQQQQQQQYQQHQQFEDQETGNLSWLLDFKLDSFIEATDDRSTAGLITTTKDNHYGSKNKTNGRSHGANYATDVRRGHGNHENSSAYRQDSNQATYPANGIDSRNFLSSRSNGPKKPPFTYTELIEHALQERGELTVSAIYQWISEHFPYYKSNDDRWKNSVRHNLSINPHFRKGSKAPHGAGHLWTIANRNECRPRPLINSVTTNTPAQQVAQSDCDEVQTNEIISEIMDEVEAATASIAQPNSEEDTDDMLNSVTLEHSAEQILNGVKREVEVQYLVPMMVANNDQEANQQNQQTAQQQTELQYPFKESDFLNPVSKEVVAEECGLISEGYLVTDLNPSTLGLNVVDSEIIGTENLFGEELSFQFYELTSPSQLQSA